MPDISVTPKIIEVNPLITPINALTENKIIETSLKTFPVETANTAKNIEIMSFGSINLTISGTGQIETIETLEIVPVYKLLASNNGRVELADKDNPNHAFNLIGMSTSSGSEGSTIFVQTGGTILNGAWSWVQGTPLWLGKDGNITQIPPETGFLIQIGVALSPSKILLEIQEANEL